MKHRVLFMLVPIGLATVLLLTLTTLQPAQAQGEIFYVNAATGDDARTPTEAQSPDTPWRTITHAVATVPSGEALNPNIIQVAAGTYNATLGEVFPIVFLNPYVQLLADPTGTTIVDGEGATPLLISIVDVEGIRIEGFSFQNASSLSIYATASPTIIGNLFDGMPAGVIVDIYKTPSADGMVPDIAINNNTFTATNEAINVLVELDANNQVFDFDLGIITINSNTINLAATGTGIDLDFRVDEANGGNVTAGLIEASGNQITGGFYGINGLNYFDVLTNSTVTAAGLRFNDNVLHSQLYTGIYIDYYDAEQITGDSVITLGDLSMIGNDIRCDLNECAGIAIDDYGDFTNISGNTIINTGNITITANTVDANDGIHTQIVSIAHLSDQSVVSGDDFWFSNNVISTTRTGITFYYDNVASENISDTQVLMGDIHALDNQIKTASDGIGISIEYVSSTGTNNAGNAYGQLPSHQIAGNTIAGGYIGIGLSSYRNMNNSMGNAMLDFGSLDVNHNDISDSSYGASLRIRELCYGCYDGSGAMVGDILVTDNTFTSHDEAGILVELDELGYEFDYTGTLTMEDVIIAGNVISNVNTGIDISTAAASSEEAKVAVGNLEVRENEIYSTTTNAIFIETHQETSDDSTLSAGETIVAGNRIEECGYDGIYLRSEKQENSSVPITQADLFADNNTVLGCNYGIDIVQANQPAHLTNNILANLDEHAISLMFTTYAEILHNTLVGSGIADTYGVFVINSVADITDTIVVSFSTGINVAGMALVWEDYNLFSGNGAPTNEIVTSGGNSLIDLNPAFADPANDDYHITLNSAALDTGVDAGIDWDIDGDGRPARGGFDIGADEYPYAIFFEPDRSGSGLPDETVVYTHTLANSGTTTDTFTLSHTSTLGWNVNYDTPIVLGPMSSAEVTVNVNIPTNALIEQVETMILTAASQSDPSIMASVTVTTTVLEVPGNSIYLPLITKE